ncbi:MAG: ferredoxin [Spirochaetaceae bacterium]|nr:MAG: ferredoxin [Spirochaetaceae bacterium]
MSRKKEPLITRRSFLIKGLRTVFAAGAGAAALGAGLHGRGENLRWQIDPDKCIQCGRCQTNCVLLPSAVKCVHAFAVCGYCDLCSGYFKTNALSLDTAAENRLCPTSAIKRTFIEDPYYQYTINKDLCIGCGKCVKGCQSFGNGSLFLQVMQDICTNCNECSIAVNCPSKAFTRVPADNAYLLKGGARLSR